jgi:hypothetical protein
MALALATGACKGLWLTPETCSGYSVPIDHSDSTLKFFDGSRVYQIFRHQLRLLPKNIGRDVTLNLLDC